MSVKASFYKSAIDSNDGTFGLNQLNVIDSGFVIEDNADTTKKLAFEASAVTTATTCTLTPPAASDTIVGLAATQTLTNKTLSTGTIIGGGILKTIVPTQSAYATPVVLTSADSGKIYCCNDAAGTDFTLPAIATAQIGMTFDFRILVEVTSNNYRWTAATGDILFGHVWLTDKDAATGDANALIGQFRPNGTSNLILTIKGSDDTQGSLIGGYLTFEALTATAWFVRGTLVGDGTLATMFS